MNDEERSKFDAIVEQLVYIHNHLESIDKKLDGVKPFE